LYGRDGEFFLNLCMGQNIIPIPMSMRFGESVRLKYRACGSSVLVEQPAVVRFLTLKKLSVKDIPTELEGVYGHEALSFVGEEMVHAFRQWESHP
jgi:hypothetical protein